VEHDFVIKKIPFKMVDVGGQRSQRQKWFQCFDGITSILFMVSSSEYDQVLMEDRRTNRLLESMNIFETIVNNKLFLNVSIILFLNKTDLLVEKVKAVSIRAHFPDFQGDPRRLEDVQRYLVQSFDRKRRNHGHRHREHPLRVPRREGHHPAGQPQGHHAAVTPRAPSRLLPRPATRAMALPCHRRRHRTPTHRRLSSWRRGRATS
jgi:hypothetical protein